MYLILWGKPWRHITAVAVPYKGTYSQVWEWSWYVVFKPGACVLQISWEVSYCYINFQHPCRWCPQRSYSETPWLNIISVFYQQYYCGVPLLLIHIIYLMLTASNLPHVVYHLACQHGQMGHQLILNHNLCMVLMVRCYWLVLYILVVPNIKLWHMMLAF